MIQYFQVDEINSVYSVKFIKHNLPFTRISGSYNLFAARVMGLNYGDYLRFIRQEYNATLKGQKGLITAFFLDKKDAVALSKYLNARLNEILQTINF